MSDVSKAALAVAATQLGQQEHPFASNWGQPVQDYLASVDIHFPASWCMAFVYWSFQKTGQPTGIFKTGGVLKQLEKSLKYVVHGAPQPGDIFILDFHDGTGHTGFVESVDGNIVHTIEGNSNNDGSRNGNEVVRHTRDITKVKAFLRF
jgi:hypothetical protein